MQSQVKSRLFSVQTASNQVYFTFFEVIQTVLDYLEERLDPVMLKASPGEQPLGALAAFKQVLEANGFDSSVVPSLHAEAAKYSTEPVFSMTAGRMMDMTYRFNLGLLGYLAGKAQEMTNPVEWVRKYQGQPSFKRLPIRRNGPVLMASINKSGQTFVCYLERTL